jgi:hypothetical protein
MSRYQAIELSACRNPADDRPLGKSGEFLSGTFGQSDVAEFPSMHAALNAGSQATNARPGCTVEAIGQTRSKRA